MTESAPLSSPGAEAIVKRIVDVINAARPMPLSTSVMISRDEVLELLEAALQELPVEVREARWLLKEREELLMKARVDAGLVIEEARTRVAQMIQKTEVVRGAERKARQLLDQAQAQARRRSHEVDDYCDRRLEQFESALLGVQETVAQARLKLQPSVPSEPNELTQDEESADSNAGFFDQDDD